MEIKGSKTEQNLLKAFAVESQLRNMCEFYKLLAQKEGYDYIGKYFENVINSRKEHAKLWLKWLNEGINMHTSDALEEITKGKYSLLGKYYLTCAKQAREEGVEHLADLFEHIAEVEKQYQVMFEKLLASVKDEDVQPDEKGNYRWECSVCGAYFDQKEMPDHCPLCFNEDIFFFKRPFDNIGEK